MTGAPKDKPKEDREAEYEALIRFHRAAGNKSTAAMYQNLLRRSQEGLPLNDRWKASEE